MIQPSELRLGNWVKDRGGKNIRIDFFEHLQDGYDCKFGMINPLSDEYGPLHPFTEYTDFANPIPLTPEILRRAGFRGHDNKWDTDAMLIIENGDGYLYLANQRHVNIFYLHQLQNLYFALTGEYLNIEL